ncbi:hypothetical protein PHYSODRAFT_484584 [Phytophthora sojae]|uniref:RxLR effector protein n=1 Tax=Phytophthora sojae (strain P6497) TaxID=1094619 RepID=G4YYB4_PHYSP|nr:hypothetical protein PHYSODRAFT_484584 [Phytophthora sojae]EGZ23265.1 hypothetical protein PHYSODRAFT_484584 [Phytophthora sojae]|eukprot:XP_009518553.1 hypothetical protein PHYSODRAFT_484584 [Phytophthora sojae]
MRFTTFLVLVIATFAACVSFSSADSAPLVDQGRNLRAEQGGLAKADDLIASAAKRNDNAAYFFQTLRNKAILTKADKLEEAGKTVKAGILREWAAPISRLTQAQKDKLSMTFAEVAKKDPKKWSTMKKLLVAALGVTVAGGLIYGVHKYNSS